MIEAFFVYSAAKGKLSLIMLQNRMPLLYIEIFNYGKVSQNLWASIMATYAREEG